MAHARAAYHKDVLESKYPSGRRVSCTSLKMWQALSLAICLSPLLVSDWRDCTSATLQHILHGSLKSQEQLYPSIRGHTDSFFFYLWARRGKKPAYFVKATYHQQSTSSLFDSYRVLRIKPLRLRVASHSECIIMLWCFEFLVCNVRPARTKCVDLD